MKINQCIIIGGGPSINEGIKKDLWKKIRWQFTIGLNYSFNYFNSTILSFVDEKFYKDELEKLKSLPLIIGKESTRTKDIKLPNTILLKNSHEYNSLNSIKKNKIYCSQLVGVFALTLAVCLMEGEGEIFLCYDKNTEVFTNKGWKLFKDLIGNELILTRKSSGITEWSPILAKQKYHYKGEMYSIKSKGIDLLVTPNHKFCLETDANYSSKYCNFKVSSDGYIWRTISDFNTSNYFIPKIFKWKGKKIEKFNINNYNIKMNHWLKFLGLYLSEGCCSMPDYKITIYQEHNKEKDSFIKKILSNLPFHYKWHKRGWIIYSKDLYNYLKPLGLSSEKYVPNYFKQLNSKGLKNLLNSLIFGDGSYNKKRKVFYYFTSSKQLADDVQEIAYKCGYNAEIYKRDRRVCILSGNKTKKQYTIIFNNKQKKQGNISRISTKGLMVRNKIKKIFYSDFVYDITVNNHTLFVRRNDKCCWSGNCGYDFGDNGKEDDKKRKITHFYQNKIDHRGIGKVSFYDTKDRARKLFEVYKKEKVRIYNVSLDSKISEDIFPKIDYKTFFNLLDLKTSCQTCLRNQIRKKLTNLL